MMSLKGIEGFKLKVFQLQLVPALLWSTSLFLLKVCCSPLAIVLRSVICTQHFGCTSIDAKLGLDIWTCKNAHDIAMSKKLNTRK